MGRLQLRTALVEDDMPLTQGGNELALIDAHAVLELHVHLVGDLVDELVGLGGRHVVAVSARGHGTVFGHAYLIEFLEVGGIDGYEMDTFVEGERVVVGLHQHAVVEREPTDIALEICIIVFHLCLDLRQN